jgi:uncharacterized protein YkwD
MKSDLARVTALTCFLLGTFTFTLSTAVLLVSDDSQDTTPPGIVRHPPESTREHPGGIMASGPGFEDQVVEIVNQERWSNGQLPPLKKESLLDDLTESHSFNMATRNFFAHCDLDTGLKPFERMIAAGRYADHGHDGLDGQLGPQGQYTFCELPRDRHRVR